MDKLLKISNLSIVLVSILSLSCLFSCTMFDKRQSDSMAILAEDAIKSHEDLEIDFKSTPQQKNK